MSVVGSTVDLAMADGVAHALRRRLDDNTYKWRTKVTLCHRVFFSKRLNHVGAKNQVVLEWLVSACDKDPSEKLEEKVYVILKEISNLLKSAVANNKDAVSHIASLLPERLASVLTRWLGHIPECKNSQLADLVCELWKYILENGLFVLYFQQNIEKFIFFFSKLIQTLARFDFNDFQLYHKFRWILFWALETAGVVRGQTITGSLMFQICYKQLRPSLYSLLTSERSINLDKDLFDKIKNAVGSLLFPRDIDQKVKEVVSLIFIPGSKQTTYWSTFSSITEQFVQSSMTETGVVTTSFFYDILLERCRNLRPDMKMNIFILLIRTLGIDLQKIKNEKSLFDQTTIDIEFNDSEESLRALQCILDAANRHLSLVTIDDNAISPIAWFQGLANFVLDTVKTRGIFWYRCIQSLLSLDCQIITPKMSVVLKVAWIDAQSYVHRENVVGQHNLLCQLLETYAKLRQVSNFLKKLFAILFEEAAGTPTLTFPKSFKKKFGEIIMNMPPGPALDIWQQLLLQIYTLFIENIKIVGNKEFEKNQKSASLVIELLSSLIMNIRVMDINLPSDVVSRLVQLSYDTADKCLSRAIDWSSSETKVPLLESSLLLGLSWGELHIALIFYNREYKRQWDALKVNNRFSSSYKEFSFLHYYVDHDCWKVVWSIGDDESNSTIRCLCRNLILQKMRMIVLLGYEDLKKKLKFLKSGTAYLIKCDNFDSADSDWNGDVTDVSNDTISTATWASICRSIVILEPNLDVDSANALAEVILSTYDWKNNAPLNQNSMGYLSQILIASSEFNESRLLQSSLMTVIINSCGTALNDVFADDVVKNVSKFMKRLSDDSEIWNQLCDTQPSQEELNPAWIKIEKASLLFNKTIILAAAEEQNIFLKTKQILLFYKRFKLLSSLPLEYLLPCNQVRCLISTFGVLMVLISQSNKNKKAVETVNLGITIILCVLDGLRSIWLLKFVDASALYVWLFRVLFPFILQVENCEDVSNYLLAQLHQNCIVLIENLTRLVKKDSTSLQIFEKFLSQVEFFPLDVSLPMDFSISLLKAVTPKASKHKNKFDAVCLSYQHKLSSCLYNWMVHFFKNGLTDQIEKDQKKLTSVLEGLEFLVGSYCDSSKPQLDMEKLISHAYNLSISVSNSQTKDIKCLRSSCNILRLVSNNDNLKTFIGKDTFQDAWMAVGNLFELRSRLNVTVEDEFEASLIRNCSLQQFEWLMQRFIQQLKLRTDVQRLKAVVDLLRLIASTKSLGADKEATFVNVSELLFIHFNNLIEEMMYSSPDMISNIFELEVSIFKSMKLPQKCLTLCLHSCTNCRLDSVEERFAYFKLLNSLFNLLNEIFESQKSSLVDLIAPFLSVVHMVFHSVVQNSQQDSLLHDNPEQLHEMSKAAQRLQRLFVLISSLKTHMSSVAPYIVSHFVKESSSLTLHPVIKNQLTEGIYAVMDLLENHSVALIVASLNQTGREVFSVLYENYKQYYSYTGRI